MSNNQKNSFVSFAEQTALISKNCTEILQKLQDVVSSQSSAVQVRFIDENGQETNYSLPTIAYLKQQIDIANTNIKRMSQFQDKSSYIIDGESTKKVIQVDLNREPSTVGEMSTVAAFEPVNNWFFESLMNPMLAVKINLSELVEDDVTKVLSRRYIVQFVKDDNGNLTQKGQSSLDDFNSKFLNRTDIDINEFVDWMNNPTNVGVLGNTNITLQSFDEQIFNFDADELENYGVFSVIKQELDSLNKKLFYHLNTLTYFDNTGVAKTLSVGDQLILNKKNSTTRYIIHEVSTAASNYRVVLERIEGYDPVPTGTNTMKLYSGVNADKYVKISIGFDEYNVVFLKAINGSNNVISTLWSKGVAFYTNNLNLSTDSTVKLSSYYLDEVYDYGRVLKDLVKKNIPSSVGLIPNSPAINIDNFKVVQINKHLTDTSDTKKVKELHSQKNQVKSQIDQLNDAINLKNKELQTKQFKTIAERSQAENELNKLNLQLDNVTKSLNSITTQITSTNIDKSIEPKYSVRGFWNIPEPRKTEGYRNQEVIQFKIQYRYSNKSGDISATEGYQIANTTGSTNAYFSNWNQMLTDARQRYFDETTGEYLWKIENVSDADTPNINQLDIAITKGEKIEIRVKSVSEVGWPTANLESEWSNSITVEFPDELGSILDSNDFVLEEAKNDSLKIEFQSTLDTKGYTQHIAESTTINQTFFAHSDKSIQTAFTDSNGNVLSLYQYLRTLTDKINSLEEMVAKSKGELKVTVFKNTKEYPVSDGATVGLSVDCEDYCTLVTAGANDRIYQNEVYLIGDYYIRIDNIAQANSLGLLSNRLYVNTGTTASNTFFKTNHLVPLVDDSNKLYKQDDNQFIWFSDSHGNNDLYDSTDVPIDASSGVFSPPALSNPNKNIGLPSLNYDINDPICLTDSVSINWKGYPLGNFLTTVLPNISDRKSLIEGGQEKIRYILPQNSITIPINIYFKLVGDNSTSVSLLTASPQSSNKKLKIFLETNNSTKSFEFVIAFNINNRKQVMKK